jgi:hypothetical protein
MKGGGEKKGREGKKRDLLTIELLIFMDGKKRKSLTEVRNFAHIRRVIYRKQRQLWKLPTIVYKFMINSESDSIGKRIEKFVEFIAL